jgi:hypothetical protein
MAAPFLHCENILATITPVGFDLPAARFRDFRATVTYACESISDKP